MNTSTKLAAFAAVLAAAFLASFGIGRAVGPVGWSTDDPAPEHIHTTP